MSQANRNRSQLSQAMDLDEGLSTDEMASNVCQYLLALQNKGIPVKKFDIVKHALNGQARHLKGVMIEVSHNLEDIFGYCLVGLKLGVKGVLTKVALNDAGMFIMVSRYPQGIVDLSGHENAQDLKKITAIRILLNSLYVVNRDVDEDSIWPMLEKSGCASVCPRSEDLRKFLKTELVDPLYLLRAETKGFEGSTFRYGWGIRAELECDKYEMLKHIAKTLDKPIQSFRKQFSELMTDEKYKNKILRHTQEANTQAADENEQNTEENEELDADDFELGDIVESQAIAETETDTEEEASPRRVSSSRRK